ncbi:choice-of-anchor J domain-containing protein [Polaribacter haliotis]|uniref:Choice-of-anchor J domain-containing protein n=1 Tax=Polaribacter haliotis TaxID=1888915 RepID=A0A7L8ADU3_9FLAO|nr:DUF5689 domain-containing protein [Polaribacter haliotis]QOD60155.1 choice-of-anchor J domain-containing protein [Polaribacter haliotis]
MKTNKIIILVLALITSISFTSCVEDGDFTVPQNLGAEENAAVEAIKAAVTAGTLQEISISNLKGLFVSGQATEITSDLVVKGFVTSSDISGNFYKELFIQDTPSSPTAAIKIAIELTDSYNKYNLGREVYVNLKGLFIGETRSGDGVIAIGGSKNEDDEIENLSLNQVETLTLRAGNTEELVGLEIKLSELNDSHVGLFVKISDAQFPTSLAGKTYVDANDAFDTQRMLEACDGFGYSNFILETSAFASFKFSVLPSGGGSISAVVSKTFNGSDLVLALNDVKDVDMEGARCAPLNIADFTVLEELDFDAGTDNTNLDFPNWTNVATEGNELWTEQIFSGNGYAEFSGFRSGDAVNVGWLISPAIDMSASSNVFLSFKSAQHHLDSDANTLEVFVSTDFDGTDVAGATWQPISANLANRSDSWYAFKDAGLTDLSSYTGTLYVGYKYTGSGTDTELDGAYMIDDFKILGK